MSVPEFNQVSLSTQRLLLRPLREGDAADLFAIFSDPQVMRYWSSPPWTDMQAAHETIAHDASGMVSGEYLRLGIESRVDGRLIGTCTLFSIVAQCRRAELGYALAHSAWGRGYMYEALNMLLSYAFCVLDFNRIEADIDPRNEASARTLQRLGFQPEGYLRERWIVDGEVSDTAFYGLLRSEWQSRTSELEQSS
jgi:[ribosomal protein S5]-alanine N-acetyltransferase